MTDLERAKQGIQSLLSVAECKANELAGKLKEVQAEAFALRNALHEVGKAMELAGKRKEVQEEVYLATLDSRTKAFATGGLNRMVEGS